MYATLMFALKICLICFLHISRERPRPGFLPELGLLPTLVRHDALHVVAVVLEEDSDKKSFGRIIFFSHRFSVDFAEICHSLESILQ